MATESNNLAVDLQKDVKEPIEQIKKHWESMQEVLDRHDQEIAKAGTASAETKQEIEKMVTAHGEKLDNLRKETDRLKADVQARELKLAGQKQGNSVYRSFAKNTKWEELNASQRMDWRNKAVNVDGSYFTKSIPSNLVGDNNASAGEIVDTTRDPRFFTEPQRILGMRNIIPVIPISGGSLEIMREEFFGDESSEGNPFGNAGYQATQLSAKNKSKLQFKLETLAPITAAGFVVTSRQVLEDVSGLQDHLGRRLVYSVDKFVNNEILNGAGTSGTLEGINTIASTLTVGAGRTIIDVIRDAMTELNKRDYFADHIVLNSADWGAIETLKVGSSDNRYVLGDPGSAAAPRMWGLPVVPQNDQPEGQFLVGNFAMGSQLRPVIGTATIRMSDSHEDLFIKNGLVWLAEERVILANHLPNAYVKGTFPSGS